MDNNNPRTVRDVYAALIKRKDAEIASLRARLAQRIDPREMLRWENHGCFLGDLVVGSMCLKVDGWVGQAGEYTVVHRATESEARAAVERAVLEALGVSQETGQ